MRLSHADGSRCSHIAHGRLSAAASCLVLPVELTASRRSSPHPAALPRCSQQVMGPTALPRLGCPRLLAGPRKQLTTGVSLPFPSGLPCHRGLVTARAASAAVVPSEQQPTTALKPRAQEKRGKNRKTQPLHTTDFAKTGAVLFIGFHPEELESVRQGLSAAAAASTPPPPVVDVTADLLSYSVRDLLLSPSAALTSERTSERNGGADHNATNHESDAAIVPSAAAPSAAAAASRTSAVSSGRVVLLVGPAAQALGAELNDWLAEWGVVPALIAAYQRKHEGMSLGSLVHSLRQAHRSYYGLLQPFKTEPLEQPPAGRSDSSDSSSIDSSEGSDSSGSNGNSSSSGNSGVERSGSSGDAPAAATESAATRASDSGSTVGATSGRCAGCSCGTGASSSSSSSDTCNSSSSRPSCGSGEGRRGGEGCGGDTSAGPADHLSVLRDVRVVLNAALDAGEVPSIHGEYRPDSGHLVVLDGLLTAAERAQLLGWLTAPSHCHDGPPPGDKWEVACVDREGDRATWGLQPSMLAALRDDPPPAIVALQTRLAALYPEYNICHMPASQISSDAPAPGDGDGGEEGEATPLSSFVGNAVMAGDPCAWHVDADPASVPPYSPWVHNYGYYHNREPGRPLFMSVLLYLNETWPEDYHSETLFLDPETQLGLFVRPAPGRVVLFDQDLPHRISPPSSLAPGPRYSLVWKLVLEPREQQQHGQGQQEGSVRGQGQVVGGYQSICRPEWGEPLRIGSANGRCGVRAFQPGARKW